MPYGVFQPPLVLFKGNADKSISNSNIETSIVPAGFGSMTLQPGTNAPGSLLRLTAMGDISSAAVPGTLTLRPKFNGVAYSLITSTPAANQILVVWTIFMLITFRAVGVAGNLTLRGGFKQHTSTSQVGPIGQWDIATDGSAIDLTIAQLFDFTIQWATASVSNIFTCTNLVLEKL